MASLNEQTCWAEIARNSGKIPAAQLQDLIALCCSEAPATLEQAQAVLEEVWGPSSNN